MREDSERLNWAYCTAWLLMSTWSFLCPHCVKEEAMHVSPNSQVESLQDHIEGVGVCSRLGSQCQKGRFMAVCPMCPGVAVGTQLSAIAADG